ncbi:MAG: ABC transporter substrate-binding protein [Syntrophaceae bacterium]|nr:ABC transporter substrate-binding protein [Syntrophaceae bacterium]
MKKVIILFSIHWLFLAGISSGQPIRVAYLQSDIHHLPCWVALEKGFFEKEGVQVRVAGIFKAGPELMSGFAAGDLDMGFVGIAPATTAVANKTARVVALAQVNTEGSAIVVRSDDNIQTVSDLMGKTVVVPGHATVQDFLLRKALLKFKAVPEQVKIMVLKPPEMIGALRTNQIDGFIAWEPFPAKAVTMGVGKVLISSKEIWKDHPCCALVSDTKFLEAHREKAKAMVRAHVKAIDFILRQREEAIQIGIQYTGMDRASVRLAMENVNYTPILSVEGEKEYVDFLTRLKYIKVDDIEAFVNGFMRTEILKEIMKK